MMRTITLEEHFTSRDFPMVPGSAFKERLLKSGARGATAVERLGDVGAKRIAAMDAAGSTSRCCR